MDSKVYVVTSLMVIVFYFALVHSMERARKPSNCQIGRRCDSCPDEYWGWVRINSTFRTKVCCVGCRSKYLTYTSAPNPTCTCHFDRLKNEPTCRKGEQCCGCDDVATVNGMPVCCDKCGNATLSLSATKCSCS